MHVEGKSQDEGAWIFVSHSHYDLQKVRRIRNALEKKGHNPLLFFLKCLDDESELPDLIRREIEARTWFILCDSHNARGSRWVQDEVEIIKSLENKVYVALDLDADLDAQVEKLAALSRRATVFISYAHQDVDIAEALRNSLREQDFAAFVDVADLPAGTNWSTAITERIDEAVRRGFFLLLLSPDALRSDYVRHETLYALQAGSARTSNIIPVIVRDREATLDGLGARLDVRHAIAGIQFFDLTAGELTARLAELIDDLKTREMETPASP